MEKYQYLFQEEKIINFEGHGIVLVREAMAIECFEHAIRCSRDSEYILEFVDDIIKNNSNEFNFKGLDYELAYKKIRDIRFTGFFSQQQSEQVQQESPFYTILDAISERVGDPYEFMEKRTWRQISNLLKGKVWNARAGVRHTDPKTNKVTYDGDKENRKMLLEEKGKEYKEIDYFDQIDALIQKNIKTKTK